MNNLVHHSPHPVEHPTAIPVDAPNFLIKPSVEAGIGQKMDQARSGEGEGPSYIEGRLLELADNHKKDVRIGARAVRKLVEVEAESRIDELTGIQNKKGFNEGLKSLVESVQGEDDPRLALLFIDLDNFKQVNDTHEDGHAAGDMVLEAVARILSQSMNLRDDEIIGLAQEIIPEEEKIEGRIGGDEFVVAIRSKVEGNDQRTEGVEAESVIGGFIARVQREVKALGLEIGIEELGASIGFVKYEKGETAEEFLKRGDLAMFENKKHQKDTSYR